MKSQIPNSKLVIEVQGRRAVVKWDERRVMVKLEEQPLLSAIAKLVKEPWKVSGIVATISKDATFSTTRQVVAVVNTMAWQLRVKINGEKQMNARYSGKPNITKPRI